MALFKPENWAPTGRSGQWDVVVGEDMCKACGFCLHICPTDVFAWRTTTNQLGWFPMYVAHEENCIGCMLCYQICPDFCINVERKPAYAAAGGEGGTLSCAPSADTVAGNGAPLSCAPSADAVAGDDL
jgi:2-oxoglutarate ferredoxin oxidoreductase subunit delta